MLIRLRIDQRGDYHVAEQRQTGNLQRAQGGDSSKQQEKESRNSKKKFSKNNKKEPIVRVCQLRMIAEKVENSPPVPSVDLPVAYITRRQESRLLPPQAKTRSAKAP
jgi:hypothetical protein